MKDSFYIYAFLLLISCHSSSKPTTTTTQQIIEALKGRDVPLDRPEPGEWLYEHPETGQSFEDYLKINPVTSTEAQNKIYLQPLGDFTNAQLKVIQYTSDYLTLFFDREVIMLPNVGVNVVPDSLKRFRGTAQQQLFTTPILDYLLKNIPKDGLIVMAITSKDLYPGGGFNFVFGQARTKKRVGVSSIYRYSAELFADSLNYQTCLERLIKTSSHEMGHMLSCKHCTNAVCVMNGANSLSEADSRPNRLCSECLRKLQWNLKFDVKSRLNKMNTYFSKHKIEKDRELGCKDLELLK